jgi:diguanylate cyclase (GGDEF)-like protein
MMINLDRFKLINDTYGHVAGDAVLRRVALILQQETRAPDLQARLGRDEFGLLIHPTTPAELNRITAWLSNGRRRGLCMRRATGRGYSGLQH